MEPKKPQNNRRTNASIDEAIMAATKEVIEEVGFAKATLKEICTKAKIEPNTFYRRFDNIDALFEHFAKRYDYWLSDIIDLQNEIEDYRASYEYIHTKLAEHLYNNKSMQQLLLWQLSEENNITRRIGQEREELSKKIMDRTSLLFKDTDVDFKAVTALLVGGIYYLILHKDRTSFCDIDFSKPAGKKKLLDVVRTIANLVFSVTIQNKEKEIEIARNLKQENIGNEIIAKATGLTIQTVEIL